MYIYSSVNRNLEFTIHPETIRLIAYINFWLMVGLAAIVTRLGVFPYPYDVENPLFNTFGYSNICINWDYSPSIYITSLIYITVEFPLLLYVAMFWLRLLQEYYANDITHTTFVICSVLSVIEFLLIFIFRMAFVSRVSEDIATNILSFTGLQVK